MRRLLVAAAVLATGGLLVAQDALLSIGLTDASARRQLAAVVSEGRADRVDPLPQAAALKFRALPAATKRSVATGLWMWARTYVNSAAFKTEYARIRAANKPSPIDYEGRNVEQELKARQDKQLADVAEGLKALALLPPADRAALEAQIKESMAYFRSREYLDMERGRIEAERATNQADFDGQIARWNDTYPEDSRALVVRHLTGFLETTLDVDWNARLLDYGGEMVFAKLDYLLKPWQWRESFWAGRDALDVARDQAAGWLTELGQPPSAAALARRDPPPAPATKPAPRRSGPPTIIAGTNHGMFLEPDGTLKTWTYASVRPNQYGEFALGHLDPVQQYALIDVPGLRTVVRASAGSDCSFAVLADGTLLAWGSRLNGQLGVTKPEEVRGDVVPGPDRSSPTPLSVKFDAVDVSASWDHVLALARDGSVYAWGTGEYGRLGIGDLPVLRIATNAPRTLRDVPYPVRVPGLSGVTAVAAGREHSLALLADGTVRAWGRNNFGQLGDGTTADRAVPVPVTGVRTAVAIAAGWRISAALLADGTMVAWGDNTNGAMGRRGPAINSVPAPVPGVAGIKTISLGDNHMVALTNSGSVLSWGYDQVGETGRNRVNSGVPTVVPRLANVIAVSAKFRRTYAVLADGSIRTWGTPVPLFGRPTGDKDISPIPIELILDGLEPTK